MMLEEKYVADSARLHLDGAIVHVCFGGPVWLMPVFFADISAWP
jgi:hypothetical protein